jgi:ATP-dependent Clp protease ATP-binding subunit ClpA
MIDSPTVAPDAAIVLGMASTAMPFARSPEAEAERWLRILRVHGEAGAALHALGVSEGRLPESERDADVERWAQSAQNTQPRTVSLAGERSDPVERVIDQAVDIARRHGRRSVATTDLLLAVICVYGEDFDRVLRAHGTDRDEVVEWLGGASVL